jgi:C-terminal processing protease CtpA/Prc
MATNGNSEKTGGLKIILALVIVLVALAIGWCMYAWPKMTEKSSSIRVGVGLYMDRNQDTHQFEIKKIFPHSPADKAGLVPGLIVNKVGGVTPNSLKDLNTLLIGPVQSKVIVEVIDPNGVTNQVEITREKFVNKSAA